MFQLRYGKTTKKKYFFEHRYLKTEPDDPQPEMSQKEPPIDPNVYKKFAARILQQKAKMQKIRYDPEHWDFIVDTNNQCKKLYKGLFIK